MESFETQTVVIGAGIVGLAIARAVARAGHEVIILEAEDAIGTQTSSRNSEVIHAGIYYEGLPLKQRFCLHGRELLYAFCDEYHVPYNRCGKLIVATEPDQIDRLQQIFAGAVRAHDKHGLKSNLFLIDQKDAEARIDGLRCTAAIVSPDTGIVDSHAMMLALQGDAERHGAFFAYKSRVTAGRVTTAGNIELDIESDGDTTRLQCQTVINAAGHGAIPVAKAISGQRINTFPNQFFARGVYFGLNAQHPFDQLVYPIPVAGGLGTHVTIDLNGQARFGPDVEWIDSLSYETDPRRADGFYEAIRTYWPALPDNALTPDYAGVRPKISGPGEPNADFDICGPERHGVPGLLHLFGIESPGLTASLAIAHEVAGRLEREAKRAA